MIPVGLSGHKAFERPLARKPAEGDGSLTGTERNPRWTRDQINYACIVMEGLFNTLGQDIIGMTTIVPLFLSELGASLGLIGGLSTMRSVVSAVVPLLFGGLVAAAPSKRRLTLALNGVGRGGLLLIPLALLLGMSGGSMIALFFGIMFVFSLCQPITGISWNYLLGNCVGPEKRGRLLGTLFGLSGVITFFSSMIIKGIRASSSLSSMGQYTAIFALGGAMVTLSVLCFLPLRERNVVVSPQEERSPKAYLAMLLLSFRNRDYNWAIITNGLGNLSMAVSAFFFLFAKDGLGLEADAISNLLIAQTLGIMLGGFITGRVSSRFGIKRMLLLVEGTAAMVPLFGFGALHLGAPFAFAAAAVFLIGFSRSGMVGYQAYILEVVEESRSIYSIVAKSMALLPLSFASVGIGAYLEARSMEPLFIFQMAVSILAVLSATRLKLTVYPRPKRESNA